MQSASIPRARAIASAPAAGRSVMRATNAARMKPDSTARAIASKFEPRPEANTAIRSRSRNDMLAPTRVFPSLSHRRSRLFGSAGLVGEASSGVEQPQLRAVAPVETHLVLAGE